MTVSVSDENKNGVTGRERGKKAGDLSTNAFMHDVVFSHNTYGSSPRRFLVLHKHIRNFRRVIWYFKNVYIRLVHEFSVCYGIRDRCMVLLAKKIDIARNFFNSVPIKTIFIAICAVCSIIYTRMPSDIYVFPSDIFSGEVWTVLLFRVAERVLMLFWATVWLLDAMFQ